MLEVSDTVAVLGTWDHNTINDTIEAGRLEHDCPPTPNPRRKETCIHHLHPCSDSWDSTAQVHTRALLGTRSEHFTAYHVGLSHPILGP